MQVNGYVARLVKDPELKQSKSGTDFCVFTVSNTEGFGDKRHTDFIRCIAFSGTAKLVANHFKAKDYIIIEGRWQNSPYKKDENGYNIDNWRYLVSGVHFLPRQQAKPADGEDEVTYTRRSKRGKEQEGNNTSSAAQSSTVASSGSVAYSSANDASDFATDDFAPVDDFGGDIPF